MKAIQAGRWSWQAWACLWGGAWVGAAAGQSAGWEQLKRGHEAEVAEAARPLREGFRKALQTLEGQLAGRGDYAGAQRVQAERRQVEKWLEEGKKSALKEPLAGSLAEPEKQAVHPKQSAAEGEVGPGEPGKPAVGVAVGGTAGKEAGVELGAAAESGGGLRWEEGAWVGWEVAGGWLRWALPTGLRGGGYGLELRYVSGGAGPLVLGIREDFHSLQRKVEVPAPGGELGAEGRLRLGTLRVRPGATFLEIKGGEAAAALGFRLTGVRLVPEGGA